MTAYAALVDSLVSHDVWLRPVRSLKPTTFQHYPLPGPWLESTEDSPPNLDPLNPEDPVFSHSLQGLHYQLIETLQQGIIIADSSGQRLYWNRKGQEICHQFQSDISRQRQRGPHQDSQPNPTQLDPAIDQPMSPLLPPVVADMCRRLQEENPMSSRAITLECYTPKGHRIRMQASWVFGEKRDHCMVIMLENCTEQLQTTVKLEQQRYSFTDRETQVWMLLRQDYTYQDIANILQITLNTVKTHVKNIYAKRRNHPDRDHIWIFQPLD